MGGEGQVLKRVPLIKFPQRHIKSSSSSSGSAPKSHDASSLSSLSSSKAKMSVGGKASDQPKRTPISNDEIEAILLGGCI